jgi:hypothetical protein
LMQAEVISSSPSPVKSSTPRLQMAPPARARKRAAVKHVIAVRQRRKLRRRSSPARRDQSLLEKKVGEWARGS